MSAIAEAAFSPAATSARIAQSLAAAERSEQPFRHWLLSGVLPERLAEAIRALPFAVPSIADTGGKRETHNALRQFFAGARLEQGPCAAIAGAFQDPATVAALQDMTGAALGGSSLRIEYCLDTDGFWLEPHTDIGAKLFTMLIYLSTGPGSAEWGTDLMSPTGEVLGRAPGSANSGLIFVPAADTWHGFARRPISGVRRSLIINYVRPEWRARHELAFPNQPVTARAA